MMKDIFFISEIASSHDGNIRTVNYLLNKHLNSSSDYIKLQIFKADALYNADDKDYRKFKKIEISYKKWKKIINKFKNKSKLILEPFDKESYEFCKNFKNKVDIKISTSETDNINVVLDAVKNFRKVFINLSGYQFKEIKIILNKIKKNKKKIILLYGFQSFPSDPLMLRFKLFDYFEAKGFKYGYSDHSIFGFSNDLIKCLFIALNKKCLFIEKHVCKDLSKKPNDYVSSVEFDDFERIIQIVRGYLKLQKIQNFSFSISEKKYAKVMHKKGFLKKKINSNSFLEIKNLKFARSSSKFDGIRRIDLLSNRYKTRKKILKNQFVKLANLKKK